MTQLYSIFIVCVIGQAAPTAATSPATAAATQPSGGTATQISGGSASQISGGTATQVSGGTTNQVSGGTTNQVSGGTATQVSGGTTNQVSGGTGDAFFDFYAANLRGSLFSGFLTLAGFLLAAKTFIIVNMKKEVYEHTAYQKKITEIRLQGLKKDAKYYGPLQRLSSLLFLTVLSSLAASVSQLTIGLYPARFAAIICLLLAALAVICLLVALFVIRQNLNELFRFLEEEAATRPNGTH